MNLAKKIVIEMDPLEAEKLSLGLKYLNNNLLSMPEKVESIPGNIIKTVSWLIAFQALLDLEIKKVNSADLGPGSEPFKMIVR